MAAASMMVHAGMGGSTLGMASLGHSAQVVSAIEDAERLLEDAERLRAAGLEGSIAAATMELGASEETDAQAAGTPLAPGTPPAPGTPQGTPPAPGTPQDTPPAPEDEDYADDQVEQQPAVGAAAAADEAVTLPMDCAVCGGEGEYCATLDEVRARACTAHTTCMYVV
eukprot:7388984-Prymnesium_polylepis.2